MKKLLLILGVILIFSLQSCVEHYSNGERIGTITRLSQKGIIWKSWEGNLNITQTGMNTSGEPFMFSMDNNKEDRNLLSRIDSAANQGWKVKVIYHECFGKNITGSRGETNYFVDDLIILDRQFTQKLQFSNQDPKISGKVIDTIFVVIVNKDQLKSDGK